MIPTVLTFPTTYDALGTTIIARMDATTLSVKKVSCFLVETGQNVVKSSAVTPGLLLDKMNTWIPAGRGFEQLIISGEMRWLEALARCRSLGGWLVVSQQDQVQTR